MKKGLLFAALLAGAMSANAQTEVCFSDTEKAGLASDKAAFTAGTVVGESDNVTMKLAYDDQWGATSIVHKDCKGAIVNGTSVTFVTGVTGNGNPGGAAVSAGASTAATSGAVVQFDVKKDGYLVVFGKLSSNKPYYVWEGLADQGAEPVAYTLAMDWSDAAQDAYPTLIYTLPADDMGYIDFAAADIAKYISGTAIKWPERIVSGDDESNVAKNGVGAIIFPVFADAGSYLVHATGSKISTCGAVFTTEPVTQLVLTGPESGNVVLIGENGETGISNAVVEKNVNAPAYNLAGQQVDASYKGIVVKNGKKVVVK